MVDPQRTLAVNRAIKDAWDAAQLGEVLEGPYWEERPVPGPNADFVAFAEFLWSKYGTVGRSNQSEYQEGVCTIRVYATEQEAAGLLLNAIMEALNNGKIRLVPPATEGNVTSFLYGDERYGRVDRGVFTAEVDFEVKRQRPKVKQPLG